MPHYNVSNIQQTRAQEAPRGEEGQRVDARMRQAAVMVQKFARMHARIRIFKEMVEKARVQRTYEGQLREARQRLEKEASERDLLAQEKGRLQADLDAAKNASAEAALAASAKSVYTISGP